MQQVDSGDMLRLASEYGGMQFYTGTGGTETLKMSISSGGVISILTAPTTDNTETNFLVRQSDGEIQQRTFASLNTGYVTLDTAQTITGNKTITATTTVIDGWTFTGNDIYADGTATNFRIGSNSSLATGISFTSGRMVIFFNDFLPGGGNDIVWGTGFDFWQYYDASANAFVIEDVVAPDDSFVIFRDNGTDRFTFDLTGTNAGKATAVDWIATSDKKIKTAIEPLENVFDKVIQLGNLTSRYQLKETGEHAIGFIAQDVQSIFPEFVTESKTGLLGLNYAKMVTPLYQAVGMLDLKIETVEQKLRKKIKELELKLNKICH
jgi:hypothetical protein